MVWSISGQGVQIGCCASTTGAGCYRRVLLLGRYASSGEAGAVFGLLGRNPTGASRSNLSRHSQVGMCLLWADNS